MAKKKKYPEIPDGVYCYTYIDEYRYVCPYHKFIPDLPYQENGYCEFLGKGDKEFNAEIEYECEWSKNDKEIGKKETANELGLPLSLLWDMCKMCDENLDYEDGEEKPNFMDKIGIGKEDPFLEEEK